MYVLPRVHVSKWKPRRRKFRPTASMTQNLRAYERQEKYNGRVVCVCACVCVCAPQVCTDEGEGAGECINLPQISTVVLGLSQPSSHLNNMMSVFPQMLLRGSFLPPLPLPKQAISLAPSYPVALPFHHNDESTWDGVATINALCPVGDYWLQSRLTAVDLPRGVRRKELTSEKKCPAAMKERKKDYWTSKSVAHARITRESRSQSRSTPSAVLEDTMHLVDLFLSAFAPSWIAKGSMRSISMTIAHPAAQVAGCSGGAPRDHGGSWKCAIACSCRAAWQWSPFCFEVFSLRMLCFTRTRTQCSFLC